MRRPFTVEFLRNIRIPQPDVHLSTGRQPEQAFILVGPLLHRVPRRVCVNVYPPDVRDRAGRAGDKFEALWRFIFEQKVPKETHQGRGDEEGGEKCPSVRYGEGMWERVGERGLKGGIHKRWDGDRRVDCCHDARKPSFCLPAKRLWKEMRNEEDGAGRAMVICPHQGWHSIQVGLRVAQWLS